MKDDGIRDSAPIPKEDSCTMVLEVIYVDPEVPSSYRHLRRGDLCYIEDWVMTLATGVVFCPLNTCYSTKSSSQAGGISNVNQ